MTWPQRSFLFSLTPRVFLLNCPQTDLEIRRRKSRMSNREVRPRIFSQVRLVSPPQPHKKPSVPPVPFCYLFIFFHLCCSPPRFSAAAALRFEDFPSHLLHLSALASLFGRMPMSCQEPSKSSCRAVTPESPALRMRTDLNQTLESLHACTSVQGVAPLRCGGASPPAEGSGRQRSSALVNTEALWEITCLHAIFFHFSLNNPVGDTRWADSCVFFFCAFLYWTRGQTCRDLDELRLENRHKIPTKLNSCYEV